MPTNMVDNKRKIEGVIFDMDGLLVDSEPVWDRARAALAAQYGKPWTTKDHHNVMGVSTAEWTTYMIEHFGATMPPKEMQKLVIDQMVSMYNEKIPFFPGAVELVQSVAAKYPTGLASGSPRQLIDIVTGYSGFDGCFQVILSADEIGKGKPAPDVYLATAERMGIDPKKCACLEDSGFGILSGKAAGMMVIAVPDERFPPADELVAQADIVLGSLAEFSLSLLEIA
ncbi:MAG: HAD family phosphatase [Chloroflexota bacterium]